MKPRPKVEHAGRATSLEELDSQGVRLAREGSLEAARTTFERLIAAARDAHREATSDPVHAQNLSLALRRCASVQDRLGDHDQALAKLREAKHLLEPLAAGHPTDPELQRDLSLLWDSMGDHYDHLGRSAEAMSFQRRSLDIARGLLATAPDDRRLRHDLFCSIERLAWSMQVSGQFVEARRLIEEQLAIGESLTSEEPEEACYRGLVATARSSLSSLLMDAGEKELAYEYAIAAVIEYRVVGQSDTSVATRHGFATALHSCGVAAASLGSTQASIHLLKEAVGVSEQLVNDASGDQKYARSLRTILTDLAATLTMTGNTTEARRYAMRAVQITRVDGM